MNAVTFIAYFATFLVANLVSPISTAQTLSTLAATPTEPSLAYAVLPADSVIKISRDMLVNPKAWTEVAQFNRLKNPNVITRGQQLNIPLRLLKFMPAASKVVSTAGDVSIGGVATAAGASLAEGTQLKTGANSSAVIELGDGSRIKLLPNSLAELVTNRNFAMRDSSASATTNWFSGLMRLSEGALEALASSSTKRATPLRIETPTSVIGVRGTEFRVAFTQAAGAAARTEVLQGKVRADSGGTGGQVSSADLPTGTGAVMKPTDTKIHVVPLLPAPDLSNLTALVLKPQGSWAMPQLAGANAYRVQVASDERFDQIVRDFNVTTGPADLSSLPNGNWFARVRGIDAAGLEGFDTVKLIVVKNGQWRVTYSSLSLADGKTTLNWTGQQADGQAVHADINAITGLGVSASSYSATLARDAALTQDAVTLQGSAAGLVLGPLKPGRYYIQLQTAAGLLSDTYRLELSGNWAATEFSKTAALQALD